MSSRAVRPSSPGASGNRALLAYFSRAGENYRYGGRVDLKIGNTQVLAELIAARAPADIYRIEAADPYPHDYEETVARNVQEEQDDTRPKIAGSLPSLDGYDTILLGSPVWNVQEPMIMRTFIEAFDWAGKTVHPFVTYAVSGMGHTQDDYTRLLPSATVSNGLAVQGETVRNSLPQIQVWLRRINLA
jgi:flavodoxin